MLCAVTPGAAFSMVECWNKAFCSSVCELINKRIRLQSRQHKFNNMGQCSQCSRNPDSAYGLLHRLLTPLLSMIKHLVQELLVHVLYPILLDIAKVCSCVCFIFPDHADLCFFLASVHCKMYLYGGMSWMLLAVHWLPVNRRLLQCQFCLKEKAVSEWHCFSTWAFWISYLQIQLQHFSPLKQ